MPAGARPRGGGRLAGSFRHYGIAYGAGGHGEPRRAPWRGLSCPRSRSFRGAARERRRRPTCWTRTGCRTASWRRRWGGPSSCTPRDGCRGRAPGSVACAPGAAPRAAGDLPSNALARAVVELGARERARDPERGRRSRSRSARRPIRRRCCSPAGSRARRGSSSWCRRQRGMNLVVAGDGPLRDQVPGARGGLPRRARNALRAGRSRRLPVAPRGIRRRLRGGDGVRSPGGRERGGRPARPRRRRRDRACSCRRATRARSEPRWNGCSATEACAGGWATPPGSACASSAAGRGSPTRRLPPTRKRWPFSRESARGCRCGSERPRAGGLPGARPYAGRGRSSASSRRGRRRIRSARAARPAGRGAQADVRRVLGEDQVVSLQPLDQMARVRGVDRNGPVRDEHAAQLSQACAGRSPGPGARRGHPRRPCRRVIGLGQLRHVGEPELEAGKQ